MMPQYTKILPLFFLLSTSFSRVHPFAPISSRSKISGECIQKGSFSSNGQVSIHPFHTGTNQRHLHKTDANARTSSTRIPASINDGLHHSLHTTSISQKVLKVLKKAIPLFASLALMKGLTTSTSRRAVNTFFLKYPYIAAFTICALKASLADFLVQKKTNNDLQKSVNGSTNTNNNKMVYGGAIVQNPSFEFKRNLAFLFYGGAYQGCIQEHIFNHIYPAMFGSGTDLVTVSVKVIFDMFITSPLLCLPVAYIIKGGIYNHSVLHSIKRYIHDIKVNKLMIKNWMGEYILLPIIPYRFSFSTMDV